MRILFIYKDYYERRKLYGRIMQQLGHKVIFLEKKHKTDFNSITIKEIKGARPDLIWFLNAYYVKYNPVAMGYIKNKKIPITFYHGVGGRFPYTNWLDVWKQFTIVFPVAYDFHEYLLRNNINSHYMPFGFHPSQYFKCLRPKKYNVSFAGTVVKEANVKNDDRCRFLNSLRKNKGVVAFGKSFKNKIDKRIIVRGCKTHKQQRLAYAHSKINLDLPFFSGGCSFYKSKFHFRNRFFEIPATGNFLLTLRTKEFLNIFPEDTVGYYDYDINSFKENVSKYLKDTKLRKKKEEKAYRLVHSKHTYTHRFKKMLKIIES